MATPKLTLFADRLARRCKGHGLRAGRWGGASRRTGNVLEIIARPRSTVLYVKDRSEPPGFWGLNESQLDSLRQSRSDWYVILLVGSAEQGYLLTSEQVERAISTRKWSFSTTDWKIHEGSELAGAYRFNSFETLFDEVLPRSLAS
jgi:hypothetical protein